MAVKLTLYSQISRHSQRVLPGLADLMLDEELIGGGGSDENDEIEADKEDEVIGEMMPEDELIDEPAEIGLRRVELEVKEGGSSAGTMFDYENSDSEIRNGQDSPQTPQSGKYSQDEEFTDPEDPVTVVKTALHIDTVTEKEELERKIKEREEEQKAKPELPIPGNEDISNVLNKLSKTKKFTLDDVEH